MDTSISAQPTSEAVAATATKKRWNALRSAVLLLIRTPSPLLLPRVLPHAVAAPRRPAGEPGVSTPMAAGTRRPRASSPGRRAGPERADARSPVQDADRAPRTAPRPLPALRC